MSEPVRKKLAEERPGLTRKIEIAKFDIYATVTFFENDQPSELFLVCGKEGSIISGLLKGIATSTSILLQHGIPFDRVLRVWKDMRFEPHCDHYKSILDALAIELPILISTRGGRTDVGCHHEPPEEDCGAPDEACGPSLAHAARPRDAQRDRGDGGSGEPRQ